MFFNNSRESSRVGRDRVTLHPAGYYDNISCSAAFTFRVTTLVRADLDFCHCLLFHCGAAEMCNTPTHIKNSINIEDFDENLKSVSNSITMDML